MQTVQTRHGQLAFEVHGEGTPMLLLHSGGHDRHDFDAVLAPLAARFRVVTLDLPGHGDSPQFDPPSTAGAGRICEAVEDALLGLHMPPTLVLGNSVGGMAALHVAARLPERVRGLVLVSPSGLVAQGPLVRAFCALQGVEWVRRYTGMAFARSYLKKRNEHTSALLARMEARREDPDFVAMEAALWRSFGQPESNLSALANAVACPTLLVWGRHDPVIRARVEGARARRLLPHAEWVELDAGHVPFVEDPSAFLAAIEPLLGPHAARVAARDVQP